MPAPSRRAARRRQGLPSWGIVRYAGDFAVLTGGTAQDLAALREQIARVPATPGLRFSGGKTRVAPMSEGPSFPGSGIQRRRRQGTARRRACTVIGERPARSLKAELGALTRRASQPGPRYVLARLDHVMRGWALCFRPAVARNAFGLPGSFAGRRVIQMLRARHRWRRKGVRRQLTAPDGGRPPITAGQAELRRVAAIPVTRYRCRGATIPGPRTAAPA
jgi:RNA-directed DNA polymerase